MPPAKLLQSGLAVGKASPSFPCLFLCVCLLYFSHLPKGGPAGGEEKVGGQARSSTSAFGLVLSVQRCVRVRRTPRKRVRGPTGLTCLSQTVHLDDKLILGVRNNQLSVRYPRSAIALDFGNLICCHVVTAQSVKQLLVIFCRQIDMASLRSVLNFMT